MPSPVLPSNDHSNGAVNSDYNGIDMTRRLGV